MGDTESFWQSAVVSRRRFLGLGALTLLGAACGGGKTEAPPAGTSAPAASTGGAAAPPPSELEKQLRIYNWAQYTDPA